MTSGVLNGNSKGNFLVPIKAQAQFPLLSAILDDVTSVFKSGNVACALKKFPMSRISGQHCGRSPLAQVDQFYDLVTGRQLSEVTQSL